MGLPLIGFLLTRQPIRIYMKGINALKSRIIFNQVLTMVSALIPPCLSFQLGRYEHQNSAVISGLDFWFFPLWEGAGAGVQGNLTKYAR